MEAYQTPPRLSLVALPSPLQRAPRLEAALATEGARTPRIYLKRDDLLGLAMGGNKIRNLEFSLGAAIAAGATDIVTAGRVQSNHCRLTAAACAIAGLRVHLVLSGSRPAQATGNLLLCELFGASLHFTGSDDRMVRERVMQDIASSLAGSGQHPRTIPVGGSDAIGAYGHVLAAHELLAQCDAIGEAAPTIVLATATGGTQAGMLVGLRQAGRPLPLLGFAVAKSAGELRASVLGVANALAHDLSVEQFSEHDITIDDAEIGAGYGVPTAAGATALELLARTEAVIADPVYTGKALAGLFALIRAGRFSPDDAVVWIHTGGAPALFADLPATAL